MAVGACASCSKVFLILFNLIFWATGIALLCFAIWMLVDPKRSYILDLVNFSEADPLLKIATYIFIAVGCVSIIIGFLGCCGALKEIQCFLATFCILLVLILCAELSAGILAFAFRQKFSGAYMSDYLRNLTHQRYDRDGWVKPLVDTIQYYGCHEKLSEWFDNHCLVFILLGIGIGLFQLVGMIFAICLCRNVGKEVRI